MKEPHRITLFNNGTFYLDLADDVFTENEYTFSLTSLKLQGDGCYLEIEGEDNLIYHYNSRTEAETDLELATKFYNITFKEI